jgi:hypothetical protein
MANPDSVLFMLSCMRGPVQVYGLMRTGPDAAQAAGASGIFPKNLVFYALGLRIRTPLAAKGASFEKNHGSNTRPIVATKLLNIEYISLE